MSKCLVTGGAGFIGSHLVDRLIELGYDVKVIDSLEEQVHKGNKPNFLNKKAQYRFGRLEDLDMDLLLSDIDYIFHLASKVGVSQSQEQIYDFIDKNICDTAYLLDNCPQNVKKIILAGSMAPYGEGTGVSDTSISEGWDLKPKSFYGITKRTQEEMIHLFGNDRNIDTISLRYFSVYGSRQAIGNPYAGPIPIFIENASKNKPLKIYEDGKQTRDFVHVSDVINANILTLKSKKTNQSYNIGTGKSTTIRELAETIIKLTKSKSKINITNKKRSGDIRHSLADIHKAKTELGYKQITTLKEGLKETIKWYGGIK